MKCAFTSGKQFAERMIWMTKKNLRLYIIGCALAALFLTLVTVGTMHIKKAGQNEYTMRLGIKGESVITLEYGEKYEEPGCSAYFSGTHFSKEPIPVEVTTASEVNDQTLGDYLLKYVASYKGVTGTAYRRVRVVDTEKPVITLVDDEKTYILPTKTYQEAGFSASDNYDGDLTQSVKRTETKDAITYTVSDTAGNVTTVTRKLIYDDPIAPTIVLKGGDIITHPLGEVFEDPGYTAMDNCDGNLTKKVTAKGSVDVNVPGYYTLKYTVKDTYKNKATAIRVVLVKYGDVTEKPMVVKPNGKVIYLTFDDGPGPRTPELLDVLKKYDIKATFFVMNTDHIDTIKRAADEGHTLAIHTASHNYKKIYASESTYFKDLQKMQKIIKKLTGVETTLIRFPGGSSNTVSKFNRGIMTRLTKKVVKEGYQYFDWNVDSDDAGKARTAERVYQNVIDGVKENDVSVVLQHDTKGYSIDAVENIIVWGLTNGYTFLPLDAASPGCHHSVNN